MSACEGAEAGTGVGPPPRALERVAMLRAVVAEIKPAARREWRHPAVVRTALRIAERRHEGDPRIPVTVTVYI